MDYRRENRFSSENVVQVVSGNSGNSVNVHGVTSFDDQAVWATEDDYRIWNGEESFDTNSNYEGKLLQSQSGRDRPNKRLRNSQSGDLTASNRSKVIGKMFYKTKLCGKFRAGTCPYITNCNFAHSNEELRKPPVNWQEIVAAQDEDRAVEPREEFQIPILGVSDEPHRSQKGRHCKKFYTEEGCPYGESCTFLHDEQSKARESVAISLGPGSGGGGYGNGSNGSGLSTLKPSNWKTRICNKWELTGYCPFGSKCHFAHGAAELLRYGGGPMDGELKDSPTSDAKQGLPSAKTSTGTLVTGGSHPDGYHIGGQSLRLSNQVQKTGLRLTQKWKGPDKISKIYGDWIDDLE